jgi:hypothetical protein
MTSKFFEATNSALQANRGLNQKKGRYSATMATNARLRPLVLLLGLILALPASAYEFPLSPTAIRQAYFLGIRQPSLGTTFLAEYARKVPNLKAGAFTSEVRIETAFTDVAVYSSRTIGYSAQDAVKDFFGKPAEFRMYLDICYMTNAPPNAVRIQVIQNRKEIAPQSEDRSAYYPATDEYTFMPSIGEQIQLRFKADKIDSSPLTIRIDTPDGQHAETEFDLQTLR